MFAKRAREAKQEQRPPQDASQTAESGPDPRDAQIQDLEQRLAEQQQTATTLREGLDAATFKIEVLEKSYAKQLADTRAQLAKVEAELGDKHKVLATFDGGHEDALRALSDARAELKLVTTERDQLRQQIAQGGLRQRSESASRAPLAYTQRAADDSGGTINELISNPSWAQKKPAAVGAGHASARVAENEAPHEEMLSPDLVFTKKDRDDER